MAFLSSNVAKFYTWNFAAGFYFMFALQAIHPLSKGISVSELALFVGITAAATTLFEIPAGLLADRLSRKLAVSLGYACEGVAFGGYVFIQNFWTLLPIALFLSLGRSLKSGAADALVFDDLQAIGRHEAFLSVTARASSFQNVSGVVGALSGPVLYAIAPATPFILSALASLSRHALCSASMSAIGLHPCVKLMSWVV